MGITDTGIRKIPYKTRRKTEATVSILCRWFCLGWWLRAEWSL